MLLQGGISILLAVIILGFLVGATLFISRSIEKFEDMQKEKTKEQELETIVQGLTNRICPIQVDVITTMAKNKAEKTTTEPTEDEYKDASIQFMKGAGSNTYPCPRLPAKVNVFSLDANSHKELALSAAYLYVRLVQLNKLMQGALRGEQGEEIPYDPWANLDPIRKAALEVSLPGMLKRYEEQRTRKPLEMNPSEKEAFLDQRIQEFKTLLDRKDETGEPELEALIVSVEREYKTLQETKKKAQTGTLALQLP